ncbi:MAG: cysteine--tRNA ligase [Chloroflexota bacterium]|nr:cysteine--tRNA ligase [Chloroflexota bacterium]MDE2897744.1 cysteine--tRNA ligase [Chloroflexota bacterium]
MTLAITNTLSGKKEPFKPLGNPVTMYVCGMTPKDRPHVGHAFMFVHMDVIRRYLEYRGYAVRYVQNFTDIDDKIIDRARVAGRDPLDWAREYTNAYFEVMDRLRIRRADEYPRVTDSIPGIIDHVQELIDGGHAYPTSTGVYFDAATFEDYGALSGRTEEDGAAGARIAVDEEKRDPRDWALWKRDDESSVTWESPWGRGRPGWHIECSTMIRHTLGERIDIHGGGADLIFPHHENELAQSEAATGRPPFVSYWTHTGLVLTDGEKMAHSVGNFTTTADVLADVPPDVLRLYLLGVHYRSPLQFSLAAIEQSRTGYQRLLAVSRAQGGADVSRETSGADLDSETAIARQAFEAAMDDDFNAPRAIGSLFEFGRAINRLAPTSTADDVERAQGVLTSLLGVLGIELHEPDAASDDATPFIDLLVHLRQQLREARQWELADEIRDDLGALDVVLEDTPDGTVWRRG